MKISVNQVVDAPDAYALEALVDLFAAAMKKKLLEKMNEGYGGWDDIFESPARTLGKALRTHLRKGDMVDVANFAAMIWNRKGK